MFLSIIIPVYNCSKYLEECLLSCLNQDVCSDDYEIICVNDGSTDNSLDILENIAESNSVYNIRIITTENRGVSHARNTGISAAKGDYVWFLDSDDFIYSNVLSKLRKTAVTTKADKIKMSSYCFINELSQNELIRFNNRTLKSNYPYKYTQITRTLIKKELIRSNNIRFQENMYFGEDTLFNFEIRHASSNEVDSSVLCYFYRKHNESTTGNASYSSTVKYAVSCVNAIEFIVNKYYKEDKNNRLTVDMLVYWIIYMLKNYSALTKDYFTENFNWEKLNVNIIHFKLFVLNKYCLSLNKDKGFIRLQKHEKTLKTINNFFDNCKRKKPKIKGYIKHPKRIISALKNKL